MRNSAPHAGVARLRGVSSSAPCGRGEGRIPGPPGRFHPSDPGRPVALPSPLLRCFFNIIPCYSRQLTETPHASDVPCCVLPCPACPARAAPCRARACVFVRAMACRPSHTPARPTASSSRSPEHRLVTAPAPFQKANLLPCNGFDWLVIARCRNLLSTADGTDERPIGF